jgi:IS30 family transposase
VQHFQVLRLSQYDCDIMPKTYKQLSAEERDILAILKSQGHSLRQIAQVLKRSPSTLSRELKRNAPPVYTGYYLAHKAQQRADTRKHQSHRRQRLKNDFVRGYVEKHICLGWSPELIAGRLRIEYPQHCISHEAIYQWIYSDATHLIASLVRAHHRRKHRGYSRKHKKSHIPGRISIKERPAAVLKRRQIGHWETDTISCRKSYQAVQVSVERKARYAKLAKLKAKTSRAMSVALVRRLCRYPAIMRRSITYDNGPENAEHLRTNKILGTASYFCQPFHSYERGTVENTIGLVRRFVPKKTNLAEVSQLQLTKIEDWLNNRPKKCLKFKTPAEVFNAECCT